MNDLKLGQLVDANAQRDAVHIAVAPVMCYDTTPLPPGTHVGFVDGDNTRVRRSSKAVGIIDPLLEAPVCWKERCWLWLYPNTITSLRHEWTHPAWQPSESRRVLEEIALGCGLRYERLMDAAARWVEDEDYTHMGENEDYKKALNNRQEEFWRHYGIVTGQAVPKEKQGYFFSCSC